ncbi:sensor domain-containing diguanylate cyclase, partial [Caballeronia calidae]|uniref:sensor domain-containing diguanylate cyclase n=1 Tax=Caballeronia calidae TaxID=1777139 RepID=UPI000ABCB42C
LLCALWITVLYRLDVERNTALHEARVSAELLAQSLESHTQQTIHDIDEIALFCKLTYESSPSQFNLSTWQAHGLLSSNTALQVTLVGADGHVLMSTGALTGDVELSDREHIAVHRHRDDVGLFLSRPVLGRVSGRWSVQGTRRIDRPDGSFGGVVVISEDPAWVTDSFYGAAALGQRGLVAVFSPDGALLSRRTGNARTPSNGTSPLALPPLLHAGNTTVVDPLDRIERIVAVRRLATYGLIVVAGLALDEALDDYVAMRHVYLAMTVLVSFMLIGFGGWISVLFSRLIRSREALQRLSETDSLTGLPNRSRMTQLLEAAVARCSTAGSTALIFVDLDEFKQINDTHGHHAGDRLLVEVAAQLRRAAGDCAVAGRLGGDEFIVLVEAANAAALAQRIAADIMAALAALVSIQTQPEGVRASLGIAALAPHETAYELLAKADLAMYEVKQQRRANRKIAQAAVAAARFELSHAACHPQARLRDAPTPPKLASLASIRAI